MSYAETQLVKLSRTGDNAAFVELVEMYKDKIQWLAYRMLNNNHDIEDVVQETFIRVYQNLNSYDESQKFSTWIYRIGRNLCIDLLRKKKMTHSLDAQVYDEASSTYYDKLEGYGPSPESSYLQTEFIEQFTAIISKLSDKYRQIITLYYIHELTLQEISERVQLPVTTVKSRLHRGRELLRKKWGTVLLFQLLVTMII